MREFDYRTITEEGIRDEYKRALERAFRIGESFRRTIGADRLPIDFKYVEAETFNAGACKLEDRYLVLINSSVPLFLLILFGRLLSDKSVFPMIETTGHLESDFALPAIVDPADFSQRAEWKIALNATRSFAAGTLADICTTFVICHEVGHIVSGHIEGGEALDGMSEIYELVTVSTPSQEVYDRRQAWELDADSVAITLLMNFVQELLETQKSDKRLSLMFGDGQSPLEHILGVCAAVLFVFFCYLKGKRDELSMTSTHPHPLVRSVYCRDLIVTAARARWKLDVSQFEELYETQMFAFMAVMEELSLFDSDLLESEYATALTENVKALPELQNRFRSSCAAWSWMSWG